MTNHGELMDTIRSLEAVRSTSAGRTRGLSERRLSIAYRRAECWSQTRDGLEVVAEARHHPGAHPAHARAVDDARGFAGDVRGDRPVHARARRSRQRREHAARARGARHWTWTGRSSSRSSRPSTSSTAAPRCASWCAEGRGSAAPARRDRSATRGSRGRALRPAFAASQTPLYFRVARRAWPDANSACAEHPRDPRHEPGCLRDGRRRRRRRAGGKAAEARQARGEPTGRAAALTLTAAEEREVAAPARPDGGGSSPTTTGLARAARCRVEIRSTSTGRVFTLPAVDLFLPSPLAAPDRAHRIPARRATATSASDRWTFLAGGGGVGGQVIERRRSVRARADGVEHDFGTIDHRRCDRPPWPAPAPRGPRVPARSTGRSAPHRSRFRCRRTTA